MSLLETIRSAENGDAVSGLARQFGLNESSIHDALSQLIPALNSGVKRNVQSPNGFDSFMGAMASGSHEKYLDAPDTLVSDTAIQDGNGILGHIFGSKDVSREVASRASQKTGIDTGILKRMLPLVAGMVMGAMRKQSKHAGIQTGQPAEREQASEILGQLLDADGDGSMVDDLWGMAKRMLK